MDPSRPNGPWRLRYHEETETGRHHRALRLGNRETAEAVKGLIQTWRDERRREEERVQAEAQRKQEAEDHKKRDLMSLRNAAMNLGGGGRRRRRRTARDFDKAAEEGPLALFAYAMFRDWDRRNPPCGRPRVKTGLW